MGLPFGETEKIRSNKKNPPLQKIEIYRITLIKALLR